MIYCIFFLEKNILIRGEIYTFGKIDIYFLCKFWENLPDFFTDKI